jgi:hypothetical protein
MGLDELAASIAANNRSARERAMSRISSLVDVTVKGSADEFSKFVRDFETDIGGPRGESLAEDESPQVVGGNGGDAVVAASSG